MKKFDCIYCCKEYELTQEEIDDGASINFCCECCADNYFETYGDLLEDF